MQERLKALLAGGRTRLVLALLAAAGLLGAAAFWGARRAPAGLPEPAFFISAIPLGSLLRPIPPPLHALYAGRHPMNQVYISMDLIEIEKYLGELRRYAADAADFDEKLWTYGEMWEWGRRWLDLKLKSFRA